MQLSKILPCYDCRMVDSVAKMVGLTGFEPVTPRLSSVCSNQLSYRPFCPHISALLVSKLSVKSGGKEIRTPDILLAKQALYQLSYAP